jgi:Domain of unknown function (DUF1707)
VPDLRASDADREQTVAALREHALAGRLTVEELDERSEAAYAAKTMRELADLQADLPTVPLRRPAPAAPRARRTLLPGTRPFTVRWRSPASAHVTMRRLMQYFTPPMEQFGYDITQRSDGRLRFERERRPWWVFPLAILMPPFSFLVLLHKQRERITIDLDEDERGTHLVANGIAPRAVRQAFLELED